MAIERYYQIEENFYQRLSVRLKNKILLYCVTGGLGRGQIIDGWSDIDILLVFKTLNRDILLTIKEVLEKNKSNIKIGPTLYSLKEFNDSLYKDPKTYHNINLIVNKILKPRIISKKLHLKYYPDLENLDNVDVAKAIHTIKRELLLGPKDFNEKKIYKLIIMIFKICLRNKNIECYAYDEIISKARKILRYDKIIPRPEQIIADSDQEKRYGNYLDFINWLEDHKYWSRGLEGIDK